MLGTVQNDFLSYIYMLQRLDDGGQELSTFLVRVVPKCVITPHFPPFITLYTCLGGTILLLPNQLS